MVLQPTSRLVYASRRLCVLLLVGASAFAHGHGGGHSGDEEKADVRAVLGPVPAALDGIQIQLRRTLAPQLLIANESGQPLTVFDENERAFLRIGSGKVEADLGAAAFHRSNTLMAPGAFAADASQAPNWQVVEPAPNWGWFDLRLRTDAVAVPHAVQANGKTAKVGAWRIPVRYNGHRSAITGHFEFAPKPQGIPEARVTDTGLFASQLLVRAMNGSARSGLFLSYSGDETLTVRGANDEPMLRFDADGVTVNRHSVTWQQVAPAGAPGYEAGDDVAWAQVSSQPSYGWVDPRIGHVGDVEADSSHSVIKRWTIPVTVGSREAAIEGVTEWKPVAAVARAQ